MERIGSKCTPIIAGARMGKRCRRFSQEELNVLVETAKGAGRPVAAHATTAEGMRRAAMAGVETIEHGDGGTAEVFELMKQKGVALCPTIAAAEAYALYFAGWVKGRMPPQRRPGGETGKLQGGARGGCHHLLWR